jgi:glycosyltransferase involved in cell wall biosynthesis/peptidoglycan/xylan/chitin deacetylase (PgdA/CDA1 family)
VRILVVNPTLGTGGAERLAVLVAGELKRRGHDVLMAYGTEDDEAALARRLGVETVRLFDAPPPGTALATWRAALRRVVAGFGPDVIHAHSLTTTAAARLAAPRTPILATVHGMPPSDELRASVLLRAASHVTAVSAASAAGLARHALAPPVEVLHAGVDVAATTLAAAEIDVPRHGRPAFACIARHHPAKGVDVLIRALPAVLAALPDAGLTLVGGGFEFDQNVALVTDLGLAEHVRIVDLVPNAAPYMAAADVLVLPSRREGLPVTALEGAALGRPFVATRVGGTPQVVRDGETGWLVAPDSPAQLAAALVAAGSDLDEARARGQQARAAVVAEWPISRMHERLEQILLELGGAPALTLKPAAYYAAKHVVQRARARHAVAPDWRGLRVLAYHRVVDARDELAIHPARFAAQMRALRAADVEIVSLEEGLRRLDAGSVDERLVAVTFDDGYRDVAEHALPVLAELDIPATIYVASAVTDGAARFTWYRTQPPLLRFDELRELAAGGRVAVGAHTRTHPSLPQLDDARARREIVDGRVELEDRIGRPVTTFAYPAGRLTARDRELVRSAGFLAGLTCEPGVNDRSTDRAALCRTLIDRRDGLAAFRDKLAGRLDGEWALRTALHARRSAPSRASRSQPT